MVHSPIPAALTYIPFQFLTTGVPNLTTCVPRITLKVYTTRPTRFIWPRSLELLEEGLGENQTSSHFRNTHSRQPFEVVLVEKDARVYVQDYLRTKLRISLGRGN